MTDKQIGVAILIVLTLIPLIYRAVTGKREAQVNIAVVAGWVMLYALGVVMAYK